jgi:hypothetical protein
LMMKVLLIMKDAGRESLAKADEVATGEGI